MDREQLMTLCIDKAIKELSWESIEFLFRPTNHLELLLRLDFEEMNNKLNDYLKENGQFCLQSEVYRQIKNAVEVETFYRKLKATYFSKTPI